MSTRRTTSVAACAIAFIACVATQTALADVVAIQRCESAAGEVVYTDRSCAASHARPTPLPQELVSRIAYDRVQSGTVVALGMYRDDITRGPVPTRRSPVEGCARSPRQLSLDLQGALALHDINRLAESFHWVGMTHRQSHRVMDRLRHLSDQPLRGAQYFNAQIGPAASAPPGSDGAGMLQLLLAGSSGASIVDLDVHRYSGCYFVSFQQT